MRTTISFCTTRVYAILVAALLIPLGGISPAHAQQSGVDVEEPELREEILDMVDEAAALRDSLDAAYGYGQQYSPADSARMAELTEHHVDRLAEIVREHGWPGISLVGEDGARAAWLTAQHADGHVRFQRAVLSFLREAVEEGEADPRHMAYLTDRVRVSEGRQQVYGTQVQFVDGIPRPFPIEEADTVDQRRAEVGLQTLDDYLSQLRAMQ